MVVPGGRSLGTLPDAKARCQSDARWYHGRMTIEVPERELGSLRLSPEQARLEFAVGLYAGRRVTLGRAARIAGVAYTEFMHEIGGRGLCINYTMEDAMHDMAMVDKLCGQRDA